MFWGILSPFIEITTDFATCPGKGPCLKSILSDLIPLEAASDLGTLYVLGVLSVLGVLTLFGVFTVPGVSAGLGFAFGLEAATELWVSNCLGVTTGLEDVTGLEVETGLEVATCLEVATGLEVTSGLVALGLGLETVVKVITGLGVAGETSVSIEEFECIFVSKGPCLSLILKSISGRRPSLA